jgi:hypothetical protein
MTKARVRRGTQQRTQKIALEKREIKWHGRRGGDIWETDYGGGAFPLCSFVLSPS